MDALLAPYYCARDTRIYVDPTFLKKLADRSGDFAAAYVVAREVGLHVQAVLRARTMRQFDMGAPPAMQRPSTQAQPSIAMQADCYAGVWTYSVRKRSYVDPSEVEDGSIVRQQRPR